MWNLNQGSTRLFLLRERFTDCPVDPPKSSARYDLAVVVSRPVSIFLRVLTGFFLFARQFFREINPGVQTTPYTGI